MVTEPVTRIIYIYIYSYEVGHTMFAKVVWTDPCDCGWGCVPRKRSFTVFIRRDVARFVGSIQTLYDAMRAKLSQKQLAIPDLLWADQTEIDAELNMLVGGMSSGKRSKAHVLTPFEMKNKAVYEKVLDDSNIPVASQVFVLGQNPEKRWKATTVECGLPTITATDRVLWVRNGQRPMTALEKFAAHGYPVRDDLAKLLGVNVSGMHFLL